MEQHPVNDARLVCSNVMLVLLAPLHQDTATHKRLCGFADNFAGIVVTHVDKLPPSVKNKTVYICGDMTEVSRMKKHRLYDAARIFVVRQGSYNFSFDSHPYTLVDMSNVPVSVHDMGVMYPRFFDETEESLFHQINSDHSFQEMTEGDKPGTAYRTGAYLSSVKQVEDDLQFNLLRCSSNLAGPTLGFRETDKRIVQTLNEEASSIFDNAAELNHVLAQVYHNKPATSSRKETKAKIKAHADKTKDMPTNGIMAFCTFYDNLKGLQRSMPDDPYDYGYPSSSGAKMTSGLTTLHFRLKDSVASRPTCHWTPEFTVKLYPGSVFFMPLSTNRLYTHEIRPSLLDAEKLPTRLGYVVRCSKTLAVHRNGQTHIVPDNGKLIPLQPPDAKGVYRLREIYRTENISDQVVDYGMFPFSMNKGDYERPIAYTQTYSFRTKTLRPVAANIFHDLYESARFENVGKGRLGAVLVQPDEKRGTPLVRTTTQYSLAAQIFKPLHQQLAQQIQHATGIPRSELNNALIEVYKDDYRKMGFHSDQALDLEVSSNIAIFSCYKFPDLANPPPRKLVIESKDQGCPNVEIPLAHNSVVVFSTQTNKTFRHKIILDQHQSHGTHNEWLGVTFRTSKTFVNYLDDGQTILEDGTKLSLADGDKQQEFFKLRGHENRRADFTYPPINYTISKSDLMSPSAI